MIKTHTSLDIIKKGRRPLDIRQLKYFIETVKIKNVSHAAKNLFITQSTLSLSLKKLEEEIGARLFFQGETPFELTQTGQILYKHSVKIVQDFDKMVSLLDKHIEHQEKSKLSVGITTLFAAQFMAQISEFIRSHPNTELELIQGGSRMLQTKLANREIDLGILSLPNYEVDHILMEPLHTTTKGYHVHIVMPDAHPLAQSEKLSFLDIKEERFSSLNEDYMLGRLLKQRGNEIGFIPNIVMYHEDVQNMLFSLFPNNSIALLPIEYRKFMNVPNLAWVPLDDRNAFYPIALSINKHVAPSKSVLDFAQVIKQQ